MDCSTYCSLCFKAKRFYVNFSMYHGLCENHDMTSSAFKCIHCESIVVLIEYTKIIDQDSRDEEIEIIESKELNVSSYDPNSENSPVADQDLISSIPYEIKDNSQHKKEGLINDPSIQSSKTGESLDRPGYKNKIVGIPDRLENIYISDDRSNGIENRESLPLIKAMIAGQIRKSCKLKGCFILVLFALVVLIIILKICL